MDVADDVVLEIDQNGAVETLETKVFEDDYVNSIELRLPTSMERVLELRQVCAFDYGDPRELPFEGSSILRSAWDLRAGDDGNDGRARQGALIGSTVGEVTRVLRIPGLYVHIGTLLPVLSHCPNLEELDCSGIDFGGDSTVEVAEALAKRVRRDAPKDSEGFYASFNAALWEARGREEAEKPLLARLFGPKSSFAKCSWFGAAALVAIGHLCPKLRVLNLRFCPRLPLAALGELGKLLPNLEEMILDGNSELKDDDLLSCTRNMRGLRVLRLGGCRELTDTGIGRAIGSLRRMPHLHTLSLLACYNMSAEGVAPVIRCRKLRHLETGAIKTTGVDKLVEAIILTGKSGDGASGGDGGGEEEDGGSDTDAEGGLESLSLRSLERMRGADVVQILEAVGKNLRELNLMAVWSCGDEVASAIGKYCPNLDTVFLGGHVMVTDVGIEALAKGCSKLRNFMGWWCEQCGDKAAEALAKYCPELEIVDFTRWAGLGEVGLRAMAQAPKLQHLVLQSCPLLTVLPPSLARVKLVVADWDALVVPPRGVTSLGSAERDANAAGVDVQRWERAKAYLAELSHGVRPLRRFKMMLVGAGRAGKTQFRRALAAWPHVAKPVENTVEGRTRGIEAENLDLVPGSDDDEPLIARCLDFGGQIAYLASHAFFLSGQCLYVLVLDVTQPEASLKHAACRWLAALQARSPGSPVIVVGSHADAFEPEVTGQTLSPEEQEEKEKKKLSAKQSWLQLRVAAILGSEAGAGGKSDEDGKGGGEGGEMGKRGRQQLARPQPFGVREGTEKLNAAVAAMESRSRKESRKLHELQLACVARAERAEALCNTMADRSFGAEDEEERKSSKDGEEGASSNSATGFSAWREARAWRAAAERARKLASRRCSTVGAVLVDSLQGGCVVLSTETRRGWAWPLAKHDPRVHGRDSAFKAVLGMDSLKEVIATLAAKHVTVDEDSSSRSPSSSSSTSSSRCAPPRRLLDLQIPRSWAELARALDAEQAKGARSVWPEFRAGVCTWKQFGVLCREFIGEAAPDVPPRVRQQRLAAAAHLLEDLGLVVYFDGSLGAAANAAAASLGPTEAAQERRRTAALDVGKRAQPMVVLRPQLLVDAVKSLIGHRYVKGGGGGDARAEEKAIAVQRDLDTGEIVWEVLDVEGEATGERLDAVEAGVDSTSELREIKEYLTSGVLRGTRLRQWWKDVVPPSLAPSFLALLESMHILVVLHDDDLPSIATGPDASPSASAPVTVAELWDVPNRIFCPLVLGQVTSATGSPATPKVDAIVRSATGSAGGGGGGGGGGDGSGVGVRRALETAASLSTLVRRQHAPCPFLVESPIGWLPRPPALGGPMRAVVRRRFRFVGGVPHGAFQRLQALLTQIGRAVRVSSGGSGGASASGVEAPFGPWWGCVEDRKPLRVAPTYNCATGEAGASAADAAGLRAWTLAGNETVLALRRGGSDGNTDPLAADCIDLIAWYSPPPPAVADPRAVGRAQVAVQQLPDLAPASWASLPSSRTETTAPWRIFLSACTAIRRLAGREFHGAVVIETLPLLERDLRGFGLGRTASELAREERADVEASRGGGEEKEEEERGDGESAQNIARGEEDTIAAHRDESDPALLRVVSELRSVPELGNDSRGASSAAAAATAAGTAAGEDESMQKAMQASGGPTVSRTAVRSARAAEDAIRREVAEAIAEGDKDDEHEDDGVDWSVTELREEFQRQLNHALVHEIAPLPLPPLITIAHTLDIDIDDEDDDDDGEGNGGMGGGGGGGAAAGRRRRRRRRRRGDKKSQKKDGAVAVDMRGAKSATENVDIKGIASGVSSSSSSSSSTEANPLASMSSGKSRDLLDTAAEYVPEGATGAVVSAAASAIQARLAASKAGDDDGSDDDDDDDEDEEPIPESIPYVHKSWAMKEATRLWRLVHRRVLLPPAPGQVPVLPACRIVPPAEYAKMEDAAILVRAVLDHASVTISRTDIVRALRAKQEEEDRAAGAQHVYHHHDSTDGKDKDPETFCEATRRGALRAWMKIIPVIVVAIVSGILIPYLLGAFEPK